MKVQVKPRVLLAMVLLGVLAYFAMQMNYKEIAIICAAGIATALGSLVEIEKG